MVSDNSGSSYKVIILSFEALNTVFIYHGSLQYWRTIEIPEILPSDQIGPVSIISSRGVVYSSILCWLILVDLDASFLIFYDIAGDCLIRETLHFSNYKARGLCGIAVCGGRLVKISRRTEGIISFPELNVYKFNGDSNDWKCDHRVRLLALGWDPVFLKMMPGT